MFNVSFNDVNWNPNAPFPMSAKATGPPNMEFGGEPDLADFGEALADFAFLEDGSVAGHHRPRSLTESESDGEDSSSPRGPDLFSRGVVPPPTTAFSLAPAPSNAPARRVLTRTVTHSDEDGEDNGADVPSSSPVSAAVEGADTFDDFLSALSHGGRVSPDHNVKAASSSTTTTTTSQVFPSAPAEMSDCDEGQDDDALPSSSELESVVSGFSSSDFEEDDLDFEEDDEDEDDLLGGGAYGRTAVPPTMSVMGLLGGGEDHEESNHDLGFLGVAAGVAGDEAAAAAFSAAAAKTASQLGSPEDAEEYEASVASSKRGRGRGTGASGRKRARKVSPPHGSQKQQHQAGARGPRSKSAHRSLASSAAAAEQQGKHAVSGAPITSASSVAPLSALKGALSSSRRRCRAYVEGLKKQMTDLSAKQRALAQAEASSDFFDAAWAAVDAKALEAEEVSVRQGVVRAFLQLRGAGVGDKARWKDLVSEDFEFVLPRTPYRSMPSSSSCSSSSKASRLAAAAAAAAASKEPLEEGQRRVVGVEAVAADASSMGALCETLRNRVRALKPDLPRKKIAGIKLVYDCGEDAASPSLARWEEGGGDDEEEDGGNTSDASSDCAAGGTPPPTTAGAAGRAAGGEAPFPGGILVSGERAMCHWRGGTSGLVACGFDSECVVDGMLRCSANPATHKLQKLELTFDVLAFTQQLQRMGLVADPASSALLMGGAAAAFPLLGMASAMFGAAAASSAAAHSLASTVTTKGPPLAIRPSSGKVPILCAKPSAAGGGMPLPGAAGGLDPAVMREMMLKAMGAASKAAKQQQQQQGSTEATASSSGTTSTATTGSSSSSGGATAAAAAAAPQQQQPMTAQQMQMQAMMMAAAMMAKTTAQTGATASGATTTSASTGGPVASTSTKTTIQPAALGKKRPAPAKAASSSVVAAAAAGAGASTYGGNRALGSAKRGACAVPPTLPVAAIAAPRASGVVSSVSTPPLPSLVPS